MSRPRPITATTADGRIVHIVTRTAGQAFGTLGQVQTVAGTVLAETNPPRPYGMDDAAIEDARQLAATLTLTPQRPTR